MDARKICLLGDFAVGKTSLVRRFVHQEFSDKYLTTVGVKVDTKPVDLGGGRALKLAIWDIAGTDTPTDLLLRYTRGTAGFLLVADATRPETLECCAQLRDALCARLGALPHALLVNKCDLEDQCVLGAADLAGRFDTALARFDTSALTGANVETAFTALARAMLEPSA